MLETIVETELPSLDLRLGASSSKLLVRDRVVVGVAAAERAGPTKQLGLEGAKTSSTPKGPSVAGAKRQLSHADRQETEETNCDDTDSLATSLQGISRDRPKFFHLLKFHYS